MAMGRSSRAWTMNRLCFFSALGGFPNAVVSAIRGYTDTGMTLCMEYSFISY